MSLLWYAIETLPKNRSVKDEFYTLFAEKSRFPQSAFDKPLTDEQKARLATIEARLKDISREAPIPEKWKGGENFMGAGVVSCDEVMSYGAGEWAYHDRTPEEARQYADDLKEELTDWRERNRGWFLEHTRDNNHRGIERIRNEIATIEAAIKWLRRWANRGYCIRASY